jgi:hypothetical protein
LVPPATVKSTPPSFAPLQSAFETTVLRVRAAGSVMVVLITAAHPLASVML